jgi:protein phosphatase
LNFTDYHITIGNSTDTGKIREQNEDYMSHFTSPMGYCIVVCDGMGGHAAGQVASQNAVNSIRQFLQDPYNEIQDIPLALKNAFEFANYQLKDMVSQNPSLKGMGTTCVLALITGKQLYTAHAGDSRIYLVRKGTIKQLTKDHSSVQRLIDTGILTEAEAELSDKKNEILKAIGIFDKVEATITTAPLTLHEHDKLVLCSDGLTGHVSNETINSVVQSISDVQEAALQLTTLANEGGGNDNITVQLIHYTGKEETRKRKFLVMKIAAILIFVAFGFSFWMYRKNYSNSTITIPMNDSLRKNFVQPVHDKVKADSGKISPGL